MHDPTPPIRPHGLCTQTPFPRSHCLRAQCYGVDLDGVWGEGGEVVVGSGEGEDGFGVGAVGFFFFFVACWVGVLGMMV